MNRRTLRWASIVGIVLYVITLGVIAYVFGQLLPAK